MPELVVKGGVVVFMVVVVDVVVVVAVLVVVVVVVAPDLLQAPQHRVGSPLATCHQRVRHKRS